MFLYQKAPIVLCVHMPYVFACTHNKVDGACWRSRLMRNVPRPQKVRNKKYTLSEDVVKVVYLCFSVVDSPRKQNQTERAATSFIKNLHLKPINTIDTTAVVSFFYKSKYFLDFFSRKSVFVLLLREDTR